MTEVAARFLSLTQGNEEGVRGGKPARTLRRVPSDKYGGESFRPLLYAYIELPSLTLRLSKNLAPTSGTYTNPESHITKGIKYAGIAPHQPPQ